MLGRGGIRVGHDESVEPAGLRAFEGYLGHVHCLQGEEGRARADLERVVGDADLDDAIWTKAVQDIGDDAGVLQRAGGGRLLDGSNHLSVGEDAAVRRGLEGERGGGEEGKRQEAGDALAEGDHVKLEPGTGTLRRDEAAV